MIQSLVLSDFGNAKSLRFLYRAENQYDAKVVRLIHMDGHCLTPSAILLA